MVKYALYFEKDRKVVVELEYIELSFHFFINLFDETIPVL